MDIELLPARTADLINLCNKTNSPKFLGFLTAEELSVAKKQFKAGEKYSFYGGYDTAERVIIGALPDWCENPQFPIVAITFNYRECDKLTHRDFLGALMSLGIARETIGDILVSAGKTVIFVTNDVSKFILTEVKKVGNVGVTLAEGFFEPLPQNGKKESRSVTVASTRLDCVVASLCNMSRKQACEKITDGYVSVNSICVTKLTANVKTDDKITIRQKGKFQLTSCDEYSKKGRIILKYDKYV